jgi:hypothetical protein
MKALGDFGALVTPHFIVACFRDAKVDVRISVDWLGLDEMTCRWVCAMVSKTGNSARAAAEWTMLL